MIALIGRPWKLWCRASHQAGEKDMGRKVDAENREMEVMQFDRGVSGGGLR